MKRILCLLGGDLNCEIEPFVMQFDTEEYEIHLFDWICTKDTLFLPSDVLGELENISYNDQAAVPCIFMSDILELTELIYRLYHQTFENFIYLFHSKPTKCSLEYDGIFAKILKTPIQAEEYIYKPLYCNYKGNIREDIEISVLGKNNFLEIKEEMIVQKNYVYKNSKHIFEPVIGEEVTILLDKSKDSKKSLYYYPFLQEQIELIRQWVKEGKFGDYLEEIDSIFQKANQQKKQIGLFQYNMFLIALEGLLTECNYLQFLFQLYSFSYLIKMTGSARLYGKFIQLALEYKDVLKEENFYFLSQQIRRWHFENVVSGENHVEATDIYEVTYDGYKKKLFKLLSPIPKEERNKEVIVVLTLQFLREGHAPTRTALERIYTLGKQMGKKVYVINTRERCTNQGMIPLYDMRGGNIVELYNRVDNMKWRDYSFDFYQCPCKMPNLDEVKRIVLKIREWKPYAIMTIADGSLVSDLCANIVPVLCVPIVFSSIPKKENQFTVIGRQLSDQEMMVLKSRGYDLDRIITSIFTFDIKPQKTKFTREELGLPEDTFILAIVGTRLSFDVDDVFFAAMEETLSFNTHLAFAGIFKDYEEWCRKIPWLREHSTFVGYQEDILAFMECVDLYVNPKRLGGGFSIIEAFTKGKPGVTIAYGDVAAAAGEIFCVADYKEMVEEIKHYITDKEFYQEMVQKGKKRAEQMTDSKRALEAILETAEQRKAFF